MNEQSLIYMTNLYNEAMDLNTKLLEELENLKSINEEHRYLNGKLREENKRLNNIINEIEKWIEEDEIKAMNTFVTGRCFNYYDIINKIEILKGKDKE